MKSNFTSIMLSGTAAAAMLLLTGCAKENRLNPVDKSCAELELTDVNSGEMLSKAAIDGTGFPRDGRIGLFFFKDEAGAELYGDSSCSNAEYSYNQDKSKWTASPAIRVGSTPGYLYGYYPYNGANKDVKAIAVESSLDGDDAMYVAKQNPVTDQTAGNVAITMKHALARVSITVKNKGYSGAAKLSRIEFVGAKTAPSGTLNALDGSITATKSDVALEVPEASQQITEAGTRYECLLVPSEVDAKAQNVTLRLTIDGQQKTVSLTGENAMKIVSGVKARLEIDLSDTGLSIVDGGIHIDEWQTVVVGGHRVTVKFDEGVNGIKKDVWVMAYEQDGDVIIKSFSNSGKTITCQLDDDTMVASTPDGNLSVFTLPSVSKDIVATIGVWGEGGRKEVTVGEHKVKVVYEEVEDIDKDVFITAYKDGSSAIIKTYSVKTGRFTQCTCTPAGKATCTPSIDAATGICTFTISDVQDDITAEVGYLKYNATVEYDSDMGSVKLNGVAVASGSPVQILYGEEAEFTAEANTGYGFVKWTDGSDKDLSTDNPYTISSVTSDITLKAIFGGLVEISAEVKPAGAGTVMGAGIYAKGSTATLTAIAGEGFAFTGWAKSDSPGTIISTDNPYEFTVSQSASYVAVFRLKDALSGVFTVAADDQGNPKKKVQFSKGNLYCSGVEFYTDKTADNYGTVKSMDNAQWGFEANQYDTTPSSDGARVENHISHFMWCADATNAMTLRYDTDWDHNTFFFAKNFTVNGYSGWGVLTGGSKGEWAYLLNTRKTIYGKDTDVKNRRYAAVMVNGMAGLLIFPDDFSSWPSGAGTEPQTFNTNSSNWNGKDYTVAEFTVLQNNGCVFLPAAGYRNGYGGNANVNNVGYNGYYWSASPSDDVDAYDLSFYSGNVSPNSNDARGRAQSVRLVTEYQSEPSAE